MVRCFLCYVMCGCKRIVLCSIFRCYELSQQIKCTLISGPKGPTVYGFSADVRKATVVELTFLSYPYGVPKPISDRHDRRGSFTPIVSQALNISQFNDFGLILNDSSGSLFEISWYAGPIFCNYMIINSFGILS